MRQFYFGALAENLSPPPESEFSKINLAYVDVRDVALAHVRALEIEEAGGKRFILNDQATNWEDWRKEHFAICLPNISELFPLRKYR